MPLLSALALLVLSALALLGCAASLPLESGPAESMAEGTNRSFRHTVTLRADPDVLWRVWTDVEGWPRWDDELKAAALEDAFGEGARGRLVPTRGPSARFSITDVVPGETYTLRTALPLGSLRIRRSWTPAGTPGAIAFTHEVSFHGLTGGLFAARFGPHYRRALPRVMEALARLVLEQNEAPS